jgi:hypothetical protein
VEEEEEEEGGRARGNFSLSLEREAGYFSSVPKYFLCSRTSIFVFWVSTS